MRFALLGADSESSALAEAAKAAGHKLVWREEAEPSADSTAWEELLDDETCDAVIVGTSATPDTRARQIQELTKQGRPLLTVHPVVPSVITYFEIDMARAETGALLQHFNPLVASSVLAQAVEWVSDGHPEFGAVEQIVATRTLSDRSRDAVTWHFARDVELLARLAGRLDRIGAHGGGGEPDSAFASLSVQLSGPRTVPARWAVEPSAQSELRVALVCQQGRATLAFDSSGRCAQLVEQGANNSNPRTTTFNETPAATAIARFAADAERHAADASTWPAALDAMELADSIEISLRRGRMIDVHHRELTEQLAFKGVMSAVGCGVLVVLVPLMLAAGWFAGLVGIPLSAYWPHVLLAFLAAFLGLQVLPKLFAKPAPAPASDNGETGAPPNLPHDSAD